MKFEGQQQIGIYLYTNSDAIRVTRALLQLYFRFSGTRWSETDLDCGRVGTPRRAAQVALPRTRAG